MTKKTSNKEQAARADQPETVTQAGGETAEQAAQAAEASEPTENEVEVLSDAAEQESYTLTAEEFAAAKAHIEKLTKEKDETVGLLQRIQADFDNFRRRNSAVRLESYEEGKRDAVKELLPALDNLERALESMGEGESVWRDGISLVYRQLLDSLKKLGLEEIEATGQFDPERHEAVLREKAEGKPSGEILEVLQKGYRVGDRIIRHCMVKVSE